MKNPQIIFGLMMITLLIFTPVKGLNCDNVNIQVSGVTLNDKIVCDNIGGYEVTGINFVNVVQKNNTLELTGNIAGKIGYGYVTVFSATAPGQIAIKSGIRIPISINGGTPPTTAPTTTTTTIKPTSTTIKPTRTPTTHQTTATPTATETKPKGAGDPVVMVALCVWGLCTVYLLRRKK
jgi:hypothetical protein